MSAATLKLAEHRPPVEVPAEEFIHLAAQLHRSLEVNDVAQAVADGGRLWTRWDRVTVMLRSGRSWRTVAVSGQTILGPKSPTSLRLTEFVRSCQKSPRSWSYDQRQPPPLSDRLSTAFTEYLAVAAPCRMQLEPIFRESLPQQDEYQASVRNDGRPIAVLVFEDFQHRGDDSARDERTEQLVRQAALAFAHAWQVRHIPLRRWFVAWNEFWQSWTASRLMFVAGALVSLWLIAHGLLTVPANLQIQATGQLVTRQHRRVFAPVEGEVVDILVTTGDRVEAGQPLLRLWDMKLHQDLAFNRSQTSEIQQSLEGLKAELHELMRNSSDTAEQARLQTQLKQQQIELQGLRQQAEILEAAVQRLVVTAPIAGTVTTTNLRDRLLQRPLGRGDLLLELADDAAGWQLDLLVPEAEFGKFQRTTDPVTPAESRVEFRLTAAPQDRYQAVVREVAPRTVDVPDVGPCIPVVAEVTQFDAAKGAWGADIEARLQGPSSSLAERLFGGFVDAIYRWSWW